MLELLRPRVPFRGRRRRSPGGARAAVVLAPLVGRPSWSRDPPGAPLRGEHHPISRPLALRHLAGVAAATSLVALTAAASASASTYSVTTTADSLHGDCTPALCSLRDAVIAANDSASDDTIALPAGTFTFARPGRDEDDAATGDLDLTDAGTLAITGAGARATIVDADRLDRVFQVHEDANVTISDLQITRGLTTDPGGGGGGIKDNGASLALVDAEVDGNVAAGVEGGYGGGIDQGSGTLSLLRTTVSRNTAGNNGGGLDLDNGDSATVTNSTIADNRVDTTVAGTRADWGVGGGGIETWVPLTLTNVTVTGNVISDPTNGTETPAGGGSGIGAHDATTTVTNSIVAGNTGEQPASADFDPASCDRDDPLTAGGPNLGDDGSCFTDLQSLDAAPGLGALTDNGGSTDTVALLAGSPAIDAATTALAPATDQRGIARPQGAAADLGAFEHVVPVPDNSAPETGTTPPPAVAPPAVAPPSAIETPSKAKAKRPVLSSVTLTRKRITVRTSLPATVTLRLTRRVRTVTRKNGKRHVQTVYRKVKTIEVKAAKAGVVRKALKRTLRHGTYRLKVSAVGVGGAAKTHTIIRRL